MEDMFGDHAVGLESPATGLVEVTPDDNAHLPYASRALNVAVTGHVRVTTLNGDIGRIFVAAGTTFPIRVKRVWATGTTASGIVALL